jgi:hypothetical protein
MHQDLKYYIYVSDTKVDQLYNQIPKKLLREIAAELTVDLKPAGVGISATFKKEQAQETRFSKLKIVVQYLEKHMLVDIGWVDAPGVYFKGTLPMFWGPLPTWDNTKVVYFGGSTQQTLLGLGGSAYHLIGQRGNATVGEPSSDLPSLVAVLSKELQLKFPNLDHFFDESAALDVIEVMAMRAKGTAQMLEFFAKRLAYDSGKLTPGRIQPRQKPVLFGTPIYVALAD